MKHRHGFAPVVLALFVSSVGCWGQTVPHTSSLAAPVGPAPDASLSTEQAVSEALLANPEIRVEVRRLSLAQLRTTTARSLDDQGLRVPAVPRIRKTRSRSARSVPESFELFGSVADAILPRKKVHFLVARRCRGQEQR